MLRAAAFIDHFHNRLDDVGITLQSSEVPHLDEIFLVTIVVVEDTEFQEMV